jgi:hypothetical protein
MTVETEVEKEAVEKGWGAMVARFTADVKKGASCHYPACGKVSQTAAYHGVPLCQEHFDLAQFISFVIYKSHEKPMHDDQFKSVVEEHK